MKIFSLSFTRYIALLNKTMHSIVEDGVFIPTFSPELSLLSPFWAKSSTAETLWKNFSQENFRNVLTVCLKDSLYVMLKLVFHSFRSKSAFIGLQFFICTVVSSWSLFHLVRGPFWVFGRPHSKPKCKNLCAYVFVMIRYALLVNYMT